MFFYNLAIYFYFLMYTLVLQFYLLCFVDCSIILPIFCTFSNVKFCSCNNRVRSFIDLHVCMTRSLISSFTLFPYSQYVVSLRNRVIN